MQNFLSFLFASGVAEETGIKQSAEFRDLGCTNSDYIFCSKDSVDSPESLAKLDGVTAIFFSGGDQVILSDYLDGTKFLEKIREIYKKTEELSAEQVPWRQL